MVFKLLRLYVRETWNSRTLAWLVLMLALTVLIGSGLPGNPANQSGFYQPVSLSVVDEDESLISYTLIDQFSGLSLVRNIYVEDLAAARKRLDTGEILLILVIPPGFYEQTTQGLERSSLTVYLNESMPAEATVFVRLLNNASGGIEAIQAALFAFQDELRLLIADPDQLFKTADAAAVDLAFKLVGRKSILKVNEEAKLDTTRYIISALASLLAMLTALLILLQVQQERRSGLHERLLLANIRWWQLLLAKQLVGLVWLAAGFAPLLAVLFRQYPSIEEWPILSAIILLYWVTSALCLILGYLGRTNETLLLAAWLGILALLLLGGCIYPLQLLPDWLQPVSILSPARWSYTVIYQALSGQRVQIYALGILAAMLAGTAVGTRLAWRHARPGA
jgi:ABC-2 type transport system permease protein